MRLIELNEKIKTAYENAMRTVDNEETMAISYGTREAALLLLKELGKSICLAPKTNSRFAKCGGTILWVLLRTGETSTKASTITL